MGSKILLLFAVVTKKPGLDILDKGEYLQSLARKTVSHKPL